MEGKLQNPCKTVVYTDRTLTEEKKKSLEITDGVRSVILIRAALLFLRMLSGVVVVCQLEMWRVVFRADGRSGVPSSARCSLGTGSRSGSSFSFHGLHLSA